MGRDDFFEANRRILNKSGSNSSQDFFDANREILNKQKVSSNKERVSSNKNPYMNNVSTLKDVPNVGDRRKACGRGIKLHQQPKAYDRIRNARRRKSKIKKMVIGATIITVVISGAVVISNLVSLSKDKDSKHVPNSTTSSIYVESSIDERNRDSSNDTETHEDSTEESNSYDNYFNYNGEYIDIVDYFNSFIDGQVYQIGTTAEINENIKDFLYNTEAGQYIQYYSKEFGVDPKMSVAIAAGESSLLHDLNDGAATGLFGLEKGIKDEFWVYDYYENKYVFIVNDPDENYDIRTNIRNGISILAYKYSIDGNIYNSLFRYNVGNYGFYCMLDENYYVSSSINDRGWRYYTDDYCSRHELGTPNYIDNIGKCLYEDNITMRCRDVEITMEYSTGHIISITKIPDYNYEEANTFDDIISSYIKSKTL